MYKLFIYKFSICQTSLEFIAKCILRVVEHVELRVTRLEKCSLRCETLV